MTNFVWVKSLINDRFWQPIRWQPIGYGWAIAATISLVTLSPARAENASINPVSLPESTAALSDPVISVAALATEPMAIPITTDGAQTASRSVSPESISPESASPTSVTPESISPESISPESASPESTSPEPASFVIAGADNFNPGLQLPPPKPDAFHLERLVTDYRSDRDNFGQHNRLMEETAQFRLLNGDAIRFKTGLNTFEQKKVETVNNIPLQVSWEHKLGNFNLHAGVGVDVFDRLAAVPNIDLEITVPIFPSVTLTGVVEQGAYKSNAQTLSNHISAWRYGVNLYWQIDKDTSLFALYRRGNYSDDNREEQSFSRLERKFGQFSIAANLFTWRFDQNAERGSGYYSPPDYLLYSGEVAWQGDVFQFLRCRLSAALGRQRTNGAFTGGNSYQALCTVKVAPNIEADVGYTYSNVQNRTTSGNAYESQTVVGQLRVTF